MNYGVGDVLSPVDLATARWQRSTGARHMTSLEDARPWGAMVAGGASLLAAVKFMAMPAEHIKWRRDGLGGDGGGWDCLAACAAHANGQRQRGLPSGDGGVPVISRRPTTRDLH